MTYLVQKTNMFKQKMKIDDNIICNKMLTVQLWCIGSGALSSQKLWWITPDCQAITFTEGHEPLSHFASRAGSVVGRIETRARVWDRKDESCRGLGLERRQCWQWADILIPPPKSVVEQKTSCWAKPVGSFLCVCVCGFEREYVQDASGGYRPSTFANDTYGLDRDFGEECKYKCYI